MKKTVKADLRSKSVEELTGQANELRGELLKSRFAAALEGKVRGVSYRNARRQIARIETILAERQQKAK